MVSEMESVASKNSSTVTSSSAAAAAATTTTINQSNNNNNIINNANYNSDNNNNNVDNVINNADMQEKYSAQSVAIEFVRQYYTMMNRAPHHLFRFYSDDSTFIHGTLDKPGETRGELYYHGQKQINNKIMSCNFSNCHTKVRQVDSMRTIGDGIVIQIVGDLSNNRQPLRRFHQTIVLAPQSPNKYYVRNDIFRYQDEMDDNMIADNDHQDNAGMLENGDSNANTTSTAATTLMTDTNAVNREMNQISEISKNEPGVIESSTSIQEEQQQQIDNVKRDEMIDIGKMMTPGDQIKQAAIQPTDNNKGMMMGSPTTIAAASSDNIDVVNNQMKDATKNLENNDVIENNDNIKRNSENIKSESKSEQQQQQHEQNDKNTDNDELSKTSNVFSAATSSNEPKTYAGILGRSSAHQTSMSANVPVAAASIGQTSMPKNDIHAGNNVNNNFQLPSSSNGDNSIGSGAGAIVPKPPPFTVNPSLSHQSTASTLNQQREQRDHQRFAKKSYNRRNDSRESGKNNDSDSADGGDHFGGGGGGTSSSIVTSISITNSNTNIKKYPDENQLFIGNLLPDSSEEIVHTIFGKYGKIVDVRINRQKTPSSSKNRNYGFITFEDPQVVDKIIAKKPIYHENHRYNVEKKQGKSTANIGGNNANNNYDRNRNDRNNSSSARNTNMQTNSMQSGGNSSGGGGGLGSNTGLRGHVSMNTGNVGQINQISGGGPRNNRSSGPNYNNSNSGNQINRGNPSGGGGGGGQGSQFSNRQMFNHPPPPSSLSQQQQQQQQQNR